MDQNTLDAARQNFSLPHDVVQLPSGGIFYKNKIKSVKVGYLTASDENLLANVGNNNQNIVISLIRNKLYEPDLKPEDLLESDIQAILLFLRNTSFGPEYTLVLNDPITNKTFENTIILDELNIKQSRVLPDSDGTFTIVLPRTNDSVKVKPLTLGETNEIENMLQSYPQGRVAPIVTYRLMKMILEVNGNSDKSKIASYVENLPIADSKYLRNFVRENIPSLDLKKTVKAPSGELVTYEVTFGVEFFRPFF